MADDTKKIISLAQMKKNQQGLIYEIRGGHQMNQKLISMGIIPGQKIMKRSEMLMHGPVIVLTQSQVEIALGHGICQRIWIEVLD